MFEIYDEVNDKDEFAKFLRRRDRDDRARRLEGTPEAKALFVASWALRDNDDIDDKTRERIIRDLSPRSAARISNRLDSRGGERRVNCSSGCGFAMPCSPSGNRASSNDSSPKKLDEQPARAAAQLAARTKWKPNSNAVSWLTIWLRGAEWLGDFGEPGRRPRPGGPGARSPGWRPDGPPPRRPDAKSIRPESPRPRSRRTTRPRRPPSPRPATRSPTATRRRPPTPTGAARSDLNEPATTLSAPLASSSYHCCSRVDRYTS